MNTSSIIQTFGVLSRKKSTFTTEINLFMTAQALFACQLPEKVKLLYRVF